MTQPKTFDEAVSRQLTLHARMKSGTRMTETEARSYSMKEGYEYRQVPEHGIGWYSVFAANGNVCKCRMKWDDKGEVLLCENCFIDGT
jgi:hypothetical protein